MTLKIFLSIVSFSLSFFLIPKKEEVQGTLQSIMLTELTVAIYITELTLSRDIVKPNQPEVNNSS